jgi:hypothetical protein
MNASDYLRDLLASQEMPEGCAELEALDDARDEVERLVREAYPDSNISFTHGGSRAKGTLVNVDYDLDLPLYIECEDTAVGETLEDIYENIAALLERKFAVRRKRSALRLRSKKGADLRVDVVPGRYTDHTRSDAYIHQNEGQKERQKTNLEEHISHVRDSGCTEEIRLGKIWRTQHNIGIKTFPLELLVIVILTEDRTGDLEARFRRVLEAFSDRIDDLRIEDPANPYGNDLSHALTDAMRREVSKAARDTLNAVDQYGWEHVFGVVEKAQNAVPRVQVLRSAAAAAVMPTRPWSSEDDDTVV